MSDKKIIFLGAAFGAAAWLIEAAVGVAFGLHGLRVTIASILIGIGLYLFVQAFSERIERRQDDAAFAGHLGGGFLLVTVGFAAILLTGIYKP